ncbi:MAG TPA: glycine hydroxymethyltransferase [Trebonia sp.]|jgi:glycine hydroxymethyltransferase|nr:glycine hydroxymethyltransferase [Trebonia sp.]
MSNTASEVPQSPAATESKSAAVAFSAALETIAAVEPSVAAAIVGELASQRRQLKLIASENYASPAVLLAMGNWMSDKYAEGTVGHRFYAGCEYVDKVEQIASDHAKALFGADHAYVQPHSGIDANLVGFWAILAKRVEEPALVKAGVKNVNDLTDADWAELRQAFNNQRMLGMSLDAGGHLTHGFRPNISGKLFDQASYGSDPETGLIDYDALRAQAREFKPLILLAGYSAYPRTPNFRILREIADEVGATFMVDMAHFAGLVAGGVLSGDLNPVPHAHVVTSTTHKSLRGPRGGFVLCTDEYAPYVDKGCPMVLGGPLGHVMAAKAVAFAEARQPAFADYAAAILTNAVALAEGLTKRGVRLVTGGTSNHIVLMDVETSFGLTGRQAESALLDAGVVTNRNSIPRDPNGAWYTSGVRLGTPALTTLGFGPDEHDEIADIITTALRATTPATETAKAKYVIDEQVAAACRQRSAGLLARHPLYPGIEL